MNRSIRFVVTCVALALLVSTATAKKSGNNNPNQAHAEDVIGKFVSFQNGIMTVNVPKGKYAGNHDLSISDGTPVLVYTSPGHPVMSKSPGAFAAATADMSVEVNVDSALHVIRVSLGDVKPAKGKSK